MEKMMREPSRGKVAKTPEDAFRSKCCDSRVKYSEDRDDSFVVAVME
jgi:hypothetical protein